MDSKRQTHPYVILALIIAIVAGGVVSVVPAPVMAQDSGQATNDNGSDCDAYRIFYSDDEDNPEDTDLNISNLSEIRNTDQEYSPSEFACAADIAIKTTNPQFFVKNDSEPAPTTLGSLRRQRVKQFDRATDQSALFQQGNGNSSEGVIEEAHISVLGVIGGGEPTFGGQYSGKPIYMSQSGTVLNFADYSLNESAEPDVCQPKEYTLNVETTSSNSSNSSTNSTNTTNTTVRAVQGVQSGSTVDVSVQGSSNSFEVKAPDGNSSNSLPTVGDVISNRNLSTKSKAGGSGNALTPSASPQITIKSINQSCSYHTFTSKDVERTMQLAGSSQSYTGGFAQSSNPLSEEIVNQDKDLRHFDYDVSAGGNQSLNLSATFQAKVFETPVSRSWKPSSDAASSEGEGEGEWSSNVGTTENIRTDRLTVNSSRDVVFTDAQNPGIEQKVIQVSEEEQYVVIQFPSASEINNSSSLTSSGTFGNVSASELQDRPLWMNMTSNSGYELDGPWNVFSMRPNGLSSIYGAGSASSSSFPDVPVTRIYADRRRPSVYSKASSSGSALSQVIAWSGRNLSTTNNVLPRGVNLYAPKPVVMDRIVVKNVPGGFQSLRTIHGETVSLEDGIEQIPYREPEMNISKTGGDSVQVKLTDPETGNPVSGRQVYLQGTNESEHVTDENGVFTAQRTGAFVKANFPGDDWKNIENVFYGSVSQTATFNSFGVLADRIVDLVVTAVAVIPFFIALFWWRGVRRDNEHLW